MTEAADTDDQSFDGMEAALQAAFAAPARAGSPSESPERSTLARLERRLGTMPRIQLPEAPEDPAVTTPPVERAAGTTGGGRYEVASQLGEGGVGVVFQATDVDLGREVAIKLVRPALAHDPDILHRFVEEAQIGGQLQHPGIVPVYELGLTSDGRPFFAMKLVKGRTLTSMLADRSGGAGRDPALLGIYLRVCETVAYAHARGVIHRDLKPSNVMVGAFGEVQVVDWGMAKVLRQGRVADSRPPRASSPRRA